MKEFNFNDDLARRVQEVSLEKKGFIGGDEDNKVIRKQEESPKEFDDDIDDYLDLTFEQALQEWKAYALSFELNIQKGMLPLEYISKLEEENENFRMDLAKLKKEAVSMSPKEQNNAYENINNKIIENTNKINAVNDFLLMYGKYFEK